MAPVASTDGNIDPFRIPDEKWADLGGVLTTNLYGLPDRVIELRRRCDHHGIPLIEDAAHAFETTVGGRLVGTFGDAAAFSLTKHVGAACGGLLAFTDDRARAELERFRDEASDPPNARGDRVLRESRHRAEALAERLHLVWPLRWLRRSLGMVERRGDNRMPLRPLELGRAIAAGPGLNALQPWVRVDRRSYRVPPSTVELRGILRRLRSVEADAARRIEGVARLRKLRAAAPAVAQGDPLPLFRVPLLLDDRGALIARLERHLRNIGYIYDPPLDEYAAPEFAETWAGPGAAQAWTSRVFPVDPLEADLFLRCLGAERRSSETCRARRFPQRVACVRRGRLFSRE